MGAAPWEYSRTGGREGSCILVEQDLVISRALVEIYSKRDLSAALAFRGGTALHKLHMNLRRGIPRISIWFRSRPSDRTNADGQSTNT